MGVDVLAVMDVLIAQNFGDQSSRLSMRLGADHPAMQARAAVAELIEADAEFDREREGYNPLYASRDRLDRYLAAEARRVAALARVTGGAE